MKTTEADPVFPRATAVQVAREFCDGLTALTEKIAVAGELRRRLDPVTRVTVLFTPRFRTLQLTAHNSRPVNLAQEWIAARISEGGLTVRRSADNIPLRGERSSHLIHRATGVPVQLITVPPAAWAHYLIQFTGPRHWVESYGDTLEAEGYRWDGESACFTHIHKAYSRTGPMETERDIFRFLRVPWLEAWERK